MNSPSENPAFNHSPDDLSFRLIEKVVAILREDYPSFIIDPLEPADQLMAKFFERAELLLNKAEAHRERRIHAYRLFRANGPLMTAREIEERFREVGWTGKIIAHTAIRPKIIQLLYSVEEEVRRRQALFEESFSLNSTGLSFTEKIEAEVAKLVRQLSVGDFAADVPALEMAISRDIEKLLRVHLQPAQRQHIRENPAAWLAVSRFMKFVCDADSVKEFSSHRKSQSVRPFELFLFASQSGVMEDHLTSVVNEITESDLTPSVWSSHSIMETYSDFE